MPETPQTFRIPDERSPSLHDAVHAAAEALDVSRGLLFRMCEAARDGFRRGDDGQRACVSRGWVPIAIAYDGAGWTVGRLEARWGRAATPAEGPAEAGRSGDTIRDTNTGL